MLVPCEDMAPVLIAVAQGTVAQGTVAQGRVAQSKVALNTVGVRSVDIEKFPSHCTHQSHSLLKILIKFLIINNWVLQTSFTINSNCSFSTNVLTRASMCNDLMENSLDLKVFTFLRFISDERQRIRNMLMRSILQYEEI